MFSRPRLNVIESDEGFSVEVLGRTGVRYIEGPRTVFVNSEVLVGSPPLVIYPSSITRWDPPYDAEVIDSAARDRIVDNIRRAFRFRGYEIAVQ
jgi:hypothetical protein